MTTVPTLIVSLICIAVVSSVPTKFGSFLDLTHRGANLCERCLPGWGVVEMCDDVNPTECRPCDKDSWSPDEPHLSACVACSFCGPDLYEDIKCSSTQDTVCDSCQNSNGQFNEDFVRKCVPQLSHIRSRFNSRPNHPSRVKDNWIQSNQLTADQQKTGEELLKSLKDQHHQLWKSGTAGDKVPEVKFKPSYHHYPIDELIHAQRRKAYILIGLSSFVFCATVVFLGCLIRRRCTRQPDYSRLFSSLGDDQKALIQESARRIEQSQSKMASPATRRKEVAVFEYGGPMIRVHENPLEPFLESETNSTIPHPSTSTGQL